MPNIRTTHARARGVVDALVIGIGVFASIATSGIGTAREETDGTRLPLYDLDEAVTESVRACPEWRFSDSPVSPAATFELSARLGRPEANVSTPVEIRLRDTPYRANGVLDASTVALVLRITVPGDEAIEWVDCSPWADISIGPAEGTVSQGSIEWRVTIAAEILTSGLGPFPWEDQSQLHLEFAE